MAVAVALLPPDGGLELVEGLDGEVGVGLVDGGVVPAFAVHAGIPGGDVGGGWAG